MSIYIVPTWHCNLNCPHCVVHTQNDYFNENLFMSELLKLKELYPDESFILHGGEPTLYKNRYYTIMNTNVINSICSNLIIDQDIIDDLNSRNISISTSWNPYRFDFITFNKWLNNIETLNNKPLVLITIDKDLIDFDKEKLLKIILKLQEIGIQEILFEPLYDNNLDNSFQHKADLFLCDTYGLWKEKKISIKNLITQQILNWDFRCNSKTLYPDGKVKRGCILGDECHKILDECLHCKFAKVCKPCVLHTRCSFYPKFYELIKGEQDA